VTAAELQLHQMVSLGLTEQDLMPQHGALASPEQSLGTDPSFWQLALTAEQQLHQMVSLGLFRPILVKPTEQDHHLMQPLGPDPSFWWLAKMASL
jgi:hypothetical protein